VRRSAEGLDRTRTRAPAEHGGITVSWGDPSAVAAAIERAAARRS
jgi:hypothetical protein